MAGHSKWNNIKRTKEVEDKKRAAAFTKAAKEIAIAVKLGESGDPEFNPMLKVAIDKAKAVNMPNDNIQRAIDRGLGVSSGDEVVIENTYEFYGPEGTAFIVEAETDNANRTLTDLKTVSNRQGLKMASAGSISWQFNEVGKIKLRLHTVSEREDIVLGLMELEGVIDIAPKEETGAENIAMTVERGSLKDSTSSIKDSFGEKVEIASAGLVKETDTLVLIKGIEERVHSILDALEDVDDVVTVYTNFNVERE